MSVVTGIMICTGVSEDECLAAINSWLALHDFSALHRVEEMCCNGKHPQMYMSGGGYNYFPNKKFADFFLTVPWKYPESAVLVLSPEEGSTFVIRPEFQEEVLFWGRNE
jgi:hypothetical protein